MPPSAPEPHECRTGCAAAWRTPLAGTPPVGEQRICRHRRRRASGPFARRYGGLSGPRVGDCKRCPDAGLPGQTGGV
eukprot:12369783-Alexandrium_andersonii.AAC.1